jgi:hypothetical protein
MCTPVILADRFPPATYDTPTSTRHVIIARAELRDRYRATSGNFVIVDTPVTGHGFTDCHGSGRSFVCDLR